MKYPHVLINYMTKSNHRPNYHLKTIFIDSGGFFSSLRSGKYTTSDDEYLAYIQKMKPDFFALRDYPCEPELLKKHNRTVKQHIYMTVDNHVSIMDLLDNYNISATPVPVIQGWKVEDYLFCLDLLRSYGLVKSYMAIGSVCRRGAVRDIRKIIVTLKDELRNVRLHGFGVSLNALRDLAVWNSLYSSDTGAWDYAARWKEYNTTLCRTGRSLSFDCAVDYLKKIDEMRCNAQKTTNLLQFCEGYR